MKEEGKNDIIRDAISRMQHDIAILKNHQEEQDERIQTLKKKQELVRENVPHTRSELEGQIKRILQELEDGIRSRADGIEMIIVQVVNDRNKKNRELKQIMTVLGS